MARTLSAAAPPKVAVTRDTLEEDVQILRSRVTLATQPDHVLLRQVLELTLRGEDPTSITRELGIDRQALIAQVQRLGARFRTPGVQPDTETVTSLFPLEPAPELVANADARTRARLQEEATQLRQGNPLPFGWDLEIRDQRTRRAVADTRTQVPVDANLESLALRIHGEDHPPTSSLLTFPMLRAVWMLVQLGQFSRVIRDDALPTRASESILLAYDALETARADGVEALQIMQRDPRLDELDSLAVRARPLAEAAVRRLEEVLTHTKGRDDLASFRERSLTAFLRTTAGIYLPVHVGELSEGQVHRIGSMLGLQTDPVSTTALSQMRKRLDDLDMARDYPWLRGVWIAATACDREDNFWEAVERLQAGDTEWAQPIQ